MKRPPPKTRKEILERVILPLNSVSQGVRLGVHSIRDVYFYRGVRQQAIVRRYIALDPSALTQKNATGAKFKRMIASQRAAKKGAGLAMKYLTEQVDGSFAEGEKGRENLLLNAAAWAEYNISEANWRDTPKGRRRKKGVNMAKVIGALFSQSVRGKFGDIVFMQRYGEQLARVRTVPSNPNTPLQAASRSNIGQLAAAWRNPGTAVTLKRVDKSAAPPTITDEVFTLLANDKTQWPNLQTFISVNARRLANNQPPIATP